MYVYCVFFIHSPADGRLGSFRTRAVVKSAALNMDVQLCVCAQSLSRVRLSATLQAAASQAPLSVGFSRQEPWSGLPCPPPGAPSDRTCVCHTGRQALYH